MTKAKQKEKALDKIMARTRNMKNALDLQCLEEYDASICAMIRLSWQLEIITKEERDALEVAEMEAYFARKNELRKEETAA